MPISAGFVGKLLLVATALEASLWLPLSCLALASVTGLFYYLRIVAALFAEAREPVEPARHREALATRAALTAIALLTVWLGLQPPPLLDEGRRAAAAIEPGPRAAAAGAAR